MTRANIDKNSRIAVYLRRSRDEEGIGAEEVLRKHKERMQLFVIEKGFENVTYYEEVASGGTIDGRPEFIRLLSMVEAGRYDVVAAIHEDRLSRGDEQDRGRIKNVFKSTGTLIMTIDNRIIDYNNANDVLMSGITGAFSEYEKKQILRRFKDGKVKAVQDGFPHSGTVAFGYFWDKNTKTAVVKEDEAKVFRRIVEMYIHERKTGEQIAAELNELNIPSKRGNYWHAEVITTMLRNDFYVGKVHYRKFKAEPYITADGMVNYKRSLNGDPQTTITAKGNHDPLVSEFEYAEIIKRIITNRRYNPKDRRLTKNKYKLSGLIRCPYCGKCQSIGAYNNREEHVRKCLKKSKTRTTDCDGTRGIGERILFEAVITDMESYKKRLFQRTEGFSDDKHDSLNRMIESHEAAIEKALKRIEKSKELFKNDLIEIDELKEEKSKVDDLIRSNESKLTELKLSKDYHDNARQNHQRKMWESEDVERLFKNECSVQEVNQILRHFIAKISYVYTENHEINLDIIYN